MKIQSSPTELQAWVKKQKKQGHKISLVPTMGFFHAGHLSLMRMAAQYGSKVVVSLFVNPLQFGENEDLASYPQARAEDAQKARLVGVDFLFVPENEDLYPPGFQTEVMVKELSCGLCGQDRPGHFNGVATVVSKLFNLVRPDYAVFGEKDFQQLAIINRLVEDLNMGVKIIPHPIVREEDGLAMSSRNSYLDKAERKTALCLYKGICLARDMFKQGERESSVIISQVSKLINSSDNTKINYLDIINSRTLESVEMVKDGDRIIMAVTIGGKVRLLDNGLLSE